MRIAKNLTIVVATALVFTGVIFATRLVSAQSNGSRFISDPSAVRDSDIAVDIIPEVPGPNQNVKMSISSYATNLNKASVSWTVDGKQLSSGTGKTTFSFTTGDVGSKTEIGIAIVVEEGGRVDKIVTIQPSQVDMLWEASESYVPPFYKGKALPVQESKVKVVAFPVEKDGSIVPSTKVYNWKKNYVVDQSNSGYGKNAFIVKNSYLDQGDTVSLTVSSQSGSGSAGVLSLNYTKPLILVYEKNPSYGLRLNKLLNNGISIGNGEITVSAQPFYFSEYKKSTTEKNMTYKWNINGKPVTPPGKPNILTLRGSTESGLATVSIGITNINTLFQEAKQSFGVTIGNK